MMRGGKMMNTIIATQQLMFFGNSMEKNLYIGFVCVSWDVKLFDCEMNSGSIFHQCFAFQRCV